MPQRKIHTLTEFYNEHFFDDETEYTLDSNLLAILESAYNKTGDTKRTITVFANHVNRLKCMHYDKVEYVNVGKDLIKRYHNEVADIHVRTIKDELADVLKLLTKQGTDTAIELRSLLFDNFQYKLNPWNSGLESNQFNITTYVCVARNTLDNKLRTFEFSINGHEDFEEAFREADDEELSAGEKIVSLMLKEE